MASYACRAFSCLFLSNLNGGKGTLSNRVFHVQTLPLPLLIVLQCAVIAESNTYLFPSPDFLKAVCLHSVLHEEFWLKLSYLLLFFIENAYY